MNNIKYFFQFIIIILLFLIFKLLGLRYSTKISGLILTFLGPLFRSNKLVISNLTKVFPNLDLVKKKNNFKTNVV